MTTNRDATTPPSVHRVDRPDGRSRAHEQAVAGRDHLADAPDAFDERDRGGEGPPPPTRADGQRGG